MPTTRFMLIATVHLLLTRGDQVLLLRRFNTGYEDGRYSVPAGHLDGNEPVRQAMRREALEEIGLDLDPDDLEVIHVVHRFTPANGNAPVDERVDFFLTPSRWSGKPRNLEPDKCDELRWVEMQSLPDATIPYIRHAIAQVLAGSAFSEFGWEHRTGLGSPHAEA